MNLTFKHIMASSQISKQYLGKSYQNILILLLDSLSPIKEREVPICLFLPLPLKVLAHATALA